jgi:hypothetical protein
VLFFILRKTLIYIFLLWPCLSNTFPNNSLTRTAHGFFCFVIQWVLKAAASIQNMVSIILEQPVFLFISILFIKAQTCFDIINLDRPCLVIKRLNPLHCWTQLNFFVNFAPTNYANWCPLITLIDAPLTIKNVLTSDPLILSLNRHNGWSITILWQKNDSSKIGRRWLTNMTNPLKSS